jgi:hypothetical protein
LNNNYELVPDDLLGNTFNPAGKWTQEMKKASYHPNQKKQLQKPKNMVREFYCQVWLQQE